MSKNRMEVEFPMYYLKHEDHNHQISKEHLKKKEGDSLAAVPHGAPSALPLQSWTQNSACGSGWRMGWNKSQLPLKPTYSPWPAASAQEVLKQVSVRKGCSPKKHPRWNFGMPRGFCLGLGVQLQPGWRTSTLACFRVAVTAMAFKQGCNRNQQKCFAHLHLWCL